MQSTDLALVHNKTANGIIDTNLDTAFHVNAKVFGADFQHGLGDGWSIRNNGKFTSYDVSPQSIFNANNSYLVTAENRLKFDDVIDMVKRFGGTPKLMYSGSKEIIANPSTLNGNGFTTDQVAETRFRSISHFVNNLAFTKDSANNSFTVGVLYASQKLHDDSDYGARVVTEVKDNPRRLDIVSVDANGKILGYLSDNGVIRNAYFYERHKGDMNSTSFFLNDEWKATDKLRLDAGVRYETAKYNTYDEDVDFGDRFVGGTPIPGAFNADGSDKDNIIANNYYRNAGLGTWTHKQTTIKEKSYTAGFNYAFDDQVAMYGRYASGNNMPTLYSADSYASGATRLSFTEIGGRYLSKWWTTSVTLFKTKFDNLAFGETNQMTGEYRDVFVKTLSTGLEIEGEIKFNKLFSLDYVSTIQRAHISGIDPNAEEAKQNGNQVLRTPNTQVRLTPTLHFDFGDLFMTYTQIGTRYADFENALKLPAYHFIDLGAQFNVAKAWTLNFKLNNLTNSIGLTEGNPRSGFNQSANNNLFYARPILGRHATLALTYKF
jgi:outer membrane receptor protein involved in Fe transport